MKQISPKIWIPVMAVILVAVGLAVYFTLPREEKKPEILTSEVKPEEEIFPEIPVDWQTYRNEQYGFEVRHPEEYQLIQGSPAGDENVFYLDLGLYENSIFILVLDEEKREIPMTEVSIWPGGKETEVVIDGKKGIKYETEFEHKGFERGIEIPPHMDKVVVIEVPSKGKVYRFRLIHSAENLEAWDIFDKMIVSFRFTD